MKGELLSGQRKVGIWGAGFTGLSLAMAMAHVGVKSILYDVSQTKIDNIKNGICDVTGLEAWSGLSLNSYVENGLIECTNNWEDMKDPNIISHHVCVPTEKGAEAWYMALNDVLNKLVEIDPVLVIIESTLGLNWMDEITACIENLEYGVSPRIDWFVSPTYTLKTLTRPYCGKNDNVSEKMHEVLSIVCDNLVKTSDMNAAAFVKALQNSLLHVSAVYACQLAVAFPDIDILECLKLAATHPRINYYFPNIQIGGYCVSLGSQYILDADKQKSQMMLNKVALEYNIINANKIAKAIGLEKYNTVGFLGVTYKGDLRVSTLTATKLLVQYLDTNNKKSYVHDPYYTDNEIKDMYGVEYFKFPDDLNNVDFIIIIADHKVYLECPVEILLKYIRPNTKILDVFGIWERYSSFFEENNIIYARLGRKGWIEKLKYGGGIK